MKPILLLQRVGQPLLTNFFLHTNDECCAPGSVSYNDAIEMAE